MPIWLKFLILLLVGTIAYAFMHALFVSNSENPGGMPRHIDQKNAISSENIELLLPVAVGRNMFKIPAPYLESVGLWDENRKIYLEPIVLEVSGTQFSPVFRDQSYNLFTDPQKRIRIRIESILSPSQLRKPPATTFKEYEAQVQNYMGIEPMERAKDLDSQLLIGYRVGGLFSEQYVGKMSSGGLMVFYCMPNHPKFIALCQVVRHHDLHIEYQFNKRYLREFEHFQVGVTNLINSFQK